MSALVMSCIHFLNSGSNPVAKLTSLSGGIGPRARLEPRLEMKGNSAIESPFFAYSRNASRRLSKQKYSPSSDLTVMCYDTDYSLLAITGNKSEHFPNIWSPVRRPSRFPPEMIGCEIPSLDWGLV
jgi:hypothetical protein